MRLPFGSRLTRSQNLLDDVNRSVRTDLPDAHSEQTIQELVLRCRRLEARQRAKVVMCVIAQTAERHVDQGAVIGFERDAQIELPCVVDLSFTCRVMRRRVFMALTPSIVQLR